MSSASTSNLTQLFRMGTEVTKQPVKLSTADAAALCGISPSQFRRAIKNTRIKSVGSYRTRYQTCPLWSLRSIKRFAESDVIAAARKRRELADDKQRRQHESVKAEAERTRLRQSATFASTMTLRDVCDALFRLNKVAKTSGYFRDEIYRLKSEVIVKLMPLQTALYRHEASVMRRICKHRMVRLCEESRNGLGNETLKPTLQYFSDDEFIWVNKTIQFSVHEFVVEGRKYCWHQPARACDFDVSELPLVETNWTPKCSGSVIVVGDFDCSSALALLRWFVDPDCPLVVTDREP